MRPAEQSSSSPPDDGLNHAQWGPGSYLRPRRCDTCQHWGTSEAQGWHSAANLEGRKFCGCPKITDGQVWNEFQPDMASAVDCEDYHAFLQTGPKFGCVHHQTKPVSDA